MNTPPSFANPYRGIVDPFPYLLARGAKFSYPMSLFTVPRPLRAPYIHQVNFTVEKTYQGMILKAGYVGKLEHNLLQMVQKNPAVYGPGATLTNTDQRRLLMPGIYSSFREVDTNSNGAYHSLESSLSRRFSHGLTFLASYTYGKLLDYYSAQNLGQTPQDPYNERADRARSDEDRNHVSAVRLFMRSHFFGRQGWMPRAFGGWSLLVWSPKQRSAGVCYQWTGLLPDCGRFRSSQPGRKSNSLAQQHRGFHSAIFQHCGIRCQPARPLRQRRTQPVPRPRRIQRRSFAGQELPISERLGSSSSAPNSSTR